MSVLLRRKFLVEEDATVNNRQVLEETIATLQFHRLVLGEEVVETAVLALQEKLQSLVGGEAVAPPLAATHHCLVVLQADLSGFTALSADMDAEQVGDLVDALWQRFDNVVRAWGGVIDKHTGDGLIALFGLPLAQDDDAERAILAALDMQVELSLFNETNLRQKGTGPLARRGVSQALQMRIGVHIGPVMLTKVGTSSEITAVGETITLVEYLEQASPVGSVLISADVYRRVVGQFSVTPQPPLSLPGRDDLLAVYTVQQEVKRTLHRDRWGTMRYDGRFLGRVAELERLQFALQESMDNSVMQVVVVNGMAGLGKSQLFAAFSRWLDLLPVRGCLLRSQAGPTGKTRPYALIRDFFDQLFHIHRRSSAAVRREKFVRGVQKIARADRVSAREQAHVMGHLLGFDFTDSPYLQDLRDEPGRLSAYAHSDLARFFTDLADTCPPLVWLVEDGQWADAASLDLIDYLLTHCANLPLLVICLARPQLLAERPSWQNTGPFSPIAVINLPPLTPIDTRHLASQLLEEVPNVPSRLVDLVVYGAQGNPLYAEQVVRLLYDSGVIAPTGESWHVNLSVLADFSLPETLPALFQARFDRLSPPEQAALGVAALAGDRFWDGMVQEAVTAVTPSTATAFAKTWQSLEQKQLIFRRRSSLFAAAVEYQFCHDLLWQVAWKAVPAAQRQAHRSALAGWLKTRAKQQAFSPEFLAFPPLPVENEEPVRGGRGG